MVTLYHNEKAVSRKLYFKSNFIDLPIWAIMLAYFSRLLFRLAPQVGVED